MPIFSSYLYNPLDGEKLHKMTKLIVSYIKSLKLDFDAVAFRGVSGALVAPSVASSLGKPLICVRKESEKTHTHYQVEGYLCDNCTYIIIDDLIDSGSTIKEIVKKIKAECKKTECKGVFLYHIYYYDEKDREHIAKNYAKKVGVPVFIPFSKIEI